MGLIGFMATVFEDCWAGYWMGRGGCQQPPKEVGGQARELLIGVVFVDFGLVLSVSST